MTLFKAQALRWLVARADGVNSKKKLILIPKYDSENDGSVLPPLFVGLPRNKITLSTHPDQNLRNSNGPNLAGVLNTIFHELGHVAGLKNELRLKDGKNLYYESAHNFGNIANVPDTFDMKTVYTYWQLFLEKKGYHYLPWENAVKMQGLSK